MPVSLQIALEAEKHLADGLTLKLWLTTKVHKSLIIFVGVLKLKFKLKLSPAPSWRHLGGGRKYSSYSFSTSALDGVSDQRHAPAVL
jgi:hypothetical protein